MADSAANIPAVARLLAFAHFMIGLLLFCFGVTDRILENVWTGSVGFGIWIGIWMCVTGAIGIPATRRERTVSRNTSAGVFMGFSITSAVFGGTLIICYSIAIAELRRKTYTDTSSDDNKEYSCEYHAELVICTMILILGVCEFAVGIWAAVCCCLIKPCICCYSNPVLQGGQVVCNANFQSTSAGYAMLQWPCHTTLAVPMDTGYGLRTFVQTPTSGLQGEQPPMTLVLSLGAVGAPITVPVQTGSGVVPIQTCAEQVHMITLPTSGGVEGPLHLMSVPTVSMA